MTGEGFKRKLTTILSADVAEYSRLMGEDETATVKTLTSYRQVMTELIKQHRGRVIDSPGDNLLAEFTSVVDAVQCSLAVQKELQARNAGLPENRRMQFRIGINLGDVIEEEDRIYGDGVNIAARLEALAEPGGICISKTAFDQIETKLPLGYKYLGEQEVKNITKPVGAYQVLMEPRVTITEEIKREKAPPIWRRKTILAGGVAFIVLVIAALIWNFYFRPPPIEPASVEKMAYPLPDKPSIAVLPFVNMSGDPEQEYIGDGITENIITALSKIPEMFVIARTSTSTYKGKSVKTQQVSEELGVRYVLEGSVQKAGDRIRVTAQLIDAISGHHLWADRYDREIEDFFDLLDEIAKKVAIELQVKLTEGDAARMSHKTENFEAWGYALEAYSLIKQVDKESIAKVRKLCEKAVKLDPAYGFAWGVLGAAHSIDASLGYSESPDKSFKLAVECTDKALKLDETLPCSTAVKGKLHMMQGQFDQAIAVGEKAIALGPSYDLPIFLLSFTMHYAGRLEESIALTKKAMRLSPCYPAYYISTLACSYFLARRYEEALEAYGELLERAQKREYPPFLAHLGLCPVYMELGRKEEARAHAAQVLKINPKFSLESLRKRYKDPAHSERLLTALRKAGLPEHPPLPLPDKPSIAVLPFVNISGDPKQEYLSDGITEQIITSISKLPRLFVIARTSSFKYKGKAVDVQQVSRELGVKYVLEGSVQRSGDRLRITAQLVDATTGHHLWAEHYDRELKDIFALQDEITKKVVTALELKLTKREDARIYARGTDNLKAYLKVIEGMHHHYYGSTPESPAIARKLGEEALALDPSYPMAYRLLAGCHHRDFWRRATKFPRKSLERGVELLRKAIELDDTSAQAHAQLGMFYALMRQYDKGIAQANRGLALEPNSAYVVRCNAHTLLWAGRYKEAIALYKQAMRLNPKSISPYTNLGVALRCAGQYEESIATLKKAIELWPNTFFSYVVLASSYSLAGREEEACETAKEVLRINPKFSFERFFGKTTPLKDKAHLKLVIEALRKAGLK